MSDASIDDDEKESTGENVDPHGFHDFEVGMDVDQKLWCVNENLRENRRLFLEARGTGGAPVVDIKSAKWEVREVLDVHFKSMFEAKGGDLILSVEVGFMLLMCS